MCAGNMRETWKLINTALNNKQLSEFLIPRINVNGNLISNSAEIVEKLNGFFTTIGSSLASAITPGVGSHMKYLPGNYQKSMGLLPTDELEIKLLISKFQNKISCGIDEIPTTILKSCSNAIAKPLAIIINCSLSQGVFPDKLKIAKVCPVFKSGDKEIIQNYRPISILPCFSKVYEKIMYSRLSNYLESKKILSEKQYGFRRNYSTYMALMHMSDKITTAIDNNEYPVGVFIDLQKAFDTLDHKILIDKLEHYGIRGILLNWFRSYLQNRKQCVACNNCTSSFQTITYGVPQGSILGPLLFITYINDISECSKILTFILFADDTNLFYSNKDLNVLFQVLNAELAKLSNWFRLNKLSLNTKKTQYILFGFKHLPATPYRPILTIDDVVIDCVEVVKFLGVIIDCKLNWKSHVSYIAQKISRSLGVINRVKRSLPKHVLLMLYNSMIYPHLTYCCIIWGSGYKSTLSCLVNLQKRALRIITNSHYCAHTSPLFISLRLLKLPDIVNYHVAQFMFKVKYSMIPLVSKSYYRVRLSTGHRTRLQPFFDIPSFHKNIREMCITVHGPILWNSLPVYIQEIDKINLFKTSLYYYYTQHY